MSFYNEDGEANADINEVFDDADSSDNMDIGGIQETTQRQHVSSADVQVKRHYRLGRYEDKPPKNNYLIRLPPAFGIQDTPFDKDTYDEAEEIQQLAEKKCLSRAESLIRWRWKRDSEGNVIRDARGNPVRESNTRIVKWSDGSYQMLIGEDKVFDLNMVDNRMNHHYIAAVEKATNTETLKEDDMYNIQSQLSERIHFIPRFDKSASTSTSQLISEQMNFLLNAPENPKSRSRRTGVRKNKIVQDTEMDDNFLEDMDDDDSTEVNVSSIKRKGKVGRYDD